MKKNNLNINKQFMVINGLLAIGAFAVVIFFIYISFHFKRDIDKKNEFVGEYNIEIANDFNGDSLAVYINDSLLLQRTMPDTILKLAIKRFNEESTIMIVDIKSDRTYPFNLNKEGSHIDIKKKENMVFIQERVNK